jgi:HlyD family secretion protein
MVQQKQIAPRKSSYWFLAGFALLFASAWTVYSNLPKLKQQSSQIAAIDSSIQVKSVAALGRIEPKESVIKVSVANAQDSRVDRLLVQQGDRVRSGQLIATLQGIDKKQVAVAEAERNVAVYRAELRQAEIGDSVESSIAVQQAEIDRLQAELATTKMVRQAAIERTQAQMRNDRADYQRYQKLYQEGVISISDLENRRKNLETAAAETKEAQAQLENTKKTLLVQIQQEKSKLKQLSAIRQVDVQVAQAELEYALSQLQKAKAELEDFYVRIPVSGQVLKVNTRVGERVNPDQGIVDLGQTDEMYVIAEVYETDVPRVRVGQKAIMISENGGFTEKLQGTVEQIGLQIQKTDLLDTDPASDKNARVVEVKIRLDPQDSKKVAGLTYMQVRVKIELN